MPAYLKPQGYHSYHSGKWHIDGTAQESGFEHSFDATGINGFFDASGNREDGVLIPPGAKDSPYYATIATADYAIQSALNSSAAFRRPVTQRYGAFQGDILPASFLIRICQKQAVVETRGEPA